MDDIIKNVKYAAYVPYKSGKKLEIADYYGGREDLAKIIIAQLEKKSPSERTERTPIYNYGKKDGTVYYSRALLTKGQYIYSAKNRIEILYKNGNGKTIIWRD